MIAEPIHPAALESPALQHLDASYPERFQGRVPLRIKMLKFVQPGRMAMLARICKHDTLLLCGNEYQCWVNSYGAVAGICANGEKLGVKPDEFEVTEWHSATNPT